MLGGHRLPPDLDPRVADDLKRGRDADYQRKIERRRLERLSRGVGHPASGHRLRTLVWTLGAAVAGFLGVAIGDVLALGALVMLASVLAAGVVVGVVHGARGRSLGFWPLVGLAIGVASVAPVYLLIGRIPFLGDGWFVAVGLLAVVALAGYGLGRWRTRTRA